jgi:AraC-like DNA-binding protein
VTGNKHRPEPRRPFRGNALPIARAVEELHGFGLSMSEIADELGIAPHSLHELIGGKQSCPAHVWERLQRLLHDRRERAPGAH